MEQIKIGWMNLESVGFYPWIAIFGIAAYFTLRSITTKGWSIIAVAAVNLLGQLYYAFPKKVEDIPGTLFFSFLQCVVAYGIFSALEWLWGTGLVQGFIAKWFKKKTDAMGGSDAPNTPPV